MDHVLIDLDASHRRRLVDLLLNQGLCILGLVTTVTALVPESPILLTGEKLVLTFRTELHDDDDDRIMVVIAIQ